MAVFEYRGLVSANGKSVTGVRDADNPKALRAALKREGILLTAANEDTKGGQGASRRAVDFGAMFRRVNVTDVAMMTRQLATLVGAGIPLVESVSALTEQVEKPELKRVLTQVRDRLNEGISLAKALEPHSKVFPPLYVNMVAAGEASGTLEQVLERLADFMESQARLRGKVSAALAYPALMLVIGSSLISVMMVAVVPKVTSIFASLDHALPWYTALLILISGILSSAQMGGFILMLGTMVSGRKMIQARGQGPQSKEEALAKKSISGWVLITIAFVAGLCLSAFFVVESIVAFGEGVLGGMIAGMVLARFVAFLGTPPGRLWRDTRMLRLPIFGPLFRMLAVARFARTLATLLEAGVPLLKAMEIVRNVIGNAKLEKTVEEAASSIREGASIAAPLKRSGDFPPIVTHMIAVGEKSGQLETMLQNVAKAYDTQVDTRVQAMTALLEPLMIVFMGGAVGFIAFSIMMPLIQMNDFVQ